MDDLELNVVPNGISGYKWFDLDIKFKSQEGAVATEHETRKLDCRKQGGDATEVVTRNIDFGSQRKMDVTYLVMSNPVKAKVEVRLGRQYYWIHTERDGQSKGTVRGEIVARIDGFDHQILLFRINDKSKAKALERWFTFPLDRSEVWVPRGSKRVHIEMKHLHVTTGDGKEVRGIPDSLSFGFNLGQWISSEDNDSAVEVKIDWEGIQQNESTVEHDVEWNVSDDAHAFTKHIEKLRDKVAMRSHGDVLEGYTGKDLKDISKRKRPILPKPADYFIEADQCVHIKLHAGSDSTTLAVSDDNCSVVGFMNQSEVWYDLGRHTILPAKYNSVVLNWGVGYEEILEPTDLNQILVELNNAAQRKDLVMKAVSTLSRYPDVEDGMNPRKALVALMIVSCESAKLDFLHKSFETGWGLTNVEFFDEKIAQATSRKMRRYIFAWEEMSRNLVHWKYHFYRRWPKSSNQLNKIGIKSKRSALEAVHLVLNRRALPDQIDVTYTIDDDGGSYTKFIKELRSTVASRRYQAAGVLPRPGDGPIWWNVQLKVAGKETWTTLALSGDDLRICGFKNQQRNLWYQIGHERTLFEQEYNAFSISMSDTVFHASLYWATFTLEENAATARKAVNALSQYSISNQYEHCTANIPDSLWYLVDEDGTDGIASPLMTLDLMVSYSARFIDVHDAVREGWLKGVPERQRSNGLEVTTARMKLNNLLWLWDYISKRALEQWKSSGGESPPATGDNVNKLLRIIGIKSPQDALKVFALIKDVPEVQEGKE